MSSETSKICDWRLSDGRTLGDLQVGDLQAIVDNVRGPVQEHARQRDAWLAEGILRHIAATRLALEQSRTAYLAAADNLTKQQQEDELVRLAAELGLEDFG